MKGIIRVYFGQSAKKYYGGASLFIGKKLIANVWEKDDANEENHMTQPQLAIKSVRYICEKYYEYLDFIEIREAVFTGFKAHDSVNAKYIKPIFDMFPRNKRHIEVNCEDAQKVKEKHAAFILSDQVPFGEIQFEEVYPIDKMANQPEKNTSTPSNKKHKKKARWKDFVKHKNS